MDKALDVPANAGAPGSGDFISEENMTTSDPEFIAHMRKVYTEEVDRPPVLGVMIIIATVAVSFAAGFIWGSM